MSSLNNTPVKYTECLGETDSGLAYKFKLESGENVVLSKKGIAVNGKAQTVSHPYMDNSIRQSTMAGATIDLEKLGEAIPFPNSVGYDVKFVWDEGDPMFSTTDLRIFVGGSVPTDDGVPLWLIERSITDRLGDISLGEWTLRNADDDVILTSASLTEDSAPAAVPSDFATA